MNKLEKLENITITYSKCLVLFLMCFIPFRNELELIIFYTLLLETINLNRIIF